ncbi:MAG: manganese efflux pump MntP family protein [Calditrichota bacterium]
MTYLEIFLLALALSADAFTVGAGLGLRYGKARQVFRLSFHFGLFQALMTWVGALAGALFLTYVERIDHWIAFGLLVLVGGRMIYLARGDHAHRLAETDLTRGFSLVGLSVAVSIDALAAGVSLPAVEAPIFASGLIIGTVAATATLLAMRLSERISELFGKRCEIAAGLVLIGLGFYILYEHMGKLIPMS